MSLAQKLKSLFGIHPAVDEDFFDDLTDALLEGDVGAKTSYQIAGQLQKICKEKKLRSEDDILAELKQLLLGCVRTVTLDVPPQKTSVFLVLGVNGVGKTTSVAKMAKWYADRGTPVVMAASDTFRAAAVDQIDMHGTRLGLRVVKHQMGSDPSAVVFDACSACTAHGGGLVLADTAGRLHNKENLVNELKKIDRVASGRASEGCYKKILVVDATTGQNAVRQAEVFHEAVGVDALVLTKYDSTAKGGVLVTIGKELGIPVLFVCTGEQYEDIAPFDPAAYASDFLGR